MIRINATPVLTIEYLATVCYSYQQIQVHAKRGVPALFILREIDILSARGLFRYRARQVAHAAIVGTLVGGVFFNKPIAITGHVGKARAQEQVDADILTNARQQYTARQIADKFTAQYIQPISSEVTVRERGSGIIGKLAGTHGVITIGETCLANTAYDTRPASIRVDGFSSGVVIFRLKRL